MHHNLALVHDQDAYEALDPVLRGVRGSVPSLQHVLRAAEAKADHRIKNLVLRAKMVVKIPA